MNIDSAKRVKDILEELDNLSRYKEMLLNKNHGRTVHFELAQHYGNTSDMEIIVISHTYTNRFIPELEKIIAELHIELKNL